LSSGRPQPYAQSDIFALDPKAVTGARLDAVSSRLPYSVAVPSQATKSRRRGEAAFEQMTKSVPPKNVELEQAQLEFERQKWQAEYTLRQAELELKREELNRSRWVNPLVIAIFAAAAAALGNAGVTLISSNQQSKLERERAAATEALNSEQSRSTLKLEQTKSEAARILEVVKTNNPDKAAANLKFLIETRGGTYAVTQRK
jgi:hypothetical protein